MILEVAILKIKAQQNRQFEAAFKQAVPVIKSSKGYIRHELRPCIEQRDQYILLVYWESLEAHEIGFRQSPAYQDWKALLHHFYDPFPVVEHYSLPLSI